MAQFVKNSQDSQLQLNKQISSLKNQNARLKVQFHQKENEHRALQVKEGRRKQHDSIASISASKIEERKQKRLQRLELQQQIDRQQKSAKDNFASDFCNCLKDNLLFVTLDALARVQEANEELREQLKKAEHYTSNLEIQRNKLDSEYSECQ